MILDVVERAINHDDLLEVPVEVPEVLDELSVLPDHGLPAQNPPDVHLLGVDLHDLVHDGVLVLLRKYHDLVLLGQPPQQLLQTRTQGGLDALPEYVLALDYGAREV